MPPALIFSHSRIKRHLLNNARAGIIEFVYFKDPVKPTKENHFLLVLDNHLSHISPAAVNFCSDNDIYIISLPAHSSHEMQPLDRGFFDLLNPID